MNASAYQGSELELFANAKHWKAYWASKVAPFLGRRNLDVGAGLGATIRLLHPLGTGHWTALEPDRELAARIASAVAAGEIPASTRIINGLLADIDPSERFDAILYIDVLEHIEDDAAELQRAVSHLSPGGHLIVLAPAHQWLYTPFDQAIGHFRRYDRRMLFDIAPTDLRVKQLCYFDSAGLLASLANKLLLQRAQPTSTQIAFWDNVLVPASTMFDRIVRGQLGKSVLMVGQRATVDSR